MTSADGPPPESRAAREQQFQDWAGRYLDDLETKGTAAGRDDGPHGCPCCGYLTLPTRGGFDICPVCFWEDDGQDDAHADEVWGGPNGELSLSAARANYRRIGASDEAMLSHVRPPLPDEHPSP